MQEVTLLTGIAVARPASCWRSRLPRRVNAANIRFSPPGVPGTVQLQITPNLTVALVVAVAMLPLSLLATWLVVRRRVRERVADLLTATTA